MEALVRLIALLAGVIVAAGVAGSAGGTRLERSLAAKTCGGDYVLANLSWGQKCLGAGEFCKIGDVEYRRYGFDCPASGHLAAYSSEPTSATATTSSRSTSPSPASVRVGRTVFL